MSNVEKNLFDDIEFCKEHITEALQCDVYKSPNNWSWWRGNIVLVQEGTALYNRLIELMRTKSDSSQWLYNVILMEVLNNLVDRHRGMLNVVSEFEQMVDSGIQKINSAEWSVDCCGGGINE